MNAVAELYPGAALNAVPREKFVSAGIDVSRGMAKRYELNQRVESPFRSDLGGRVEFTGEGIITEMAATCYGSIGLVIRYRIIEWVKDGRVVAISADPKGAPIPAAELGIPVYSDEAIEAHRKQQFIRRPRAAQPQPGDQP